MVRIFLLLIGLLLYFIQNFIQPVSINFQLVLLITGIILLGVPHGAADLLVAAKTATRNNRNFSRKAFHFNYISRMVVFGCLLCWFPLPGIILFILFAAYHFGESDLNNFQTTTFFDKIYVTVYGLIILAVILLPHLPKPLHDIPGTEDKIMIISNILSSYSYIIVPWMIISFLFLSVFYFHYKHIKLKTRVLFFGQFSILLFILYNLPVIIGFVFYFVGWHSVLSLKYIVEYLRKDGLTTGKKIASQIAFYSLLAIVGMMLSAGAGFIFFNNNSPSLYIFLGLAVLTAPHMHIMHNMYYTISCKRQKENNTFIQPSLP